MAEERDDIGADLRAAMDGTLGQASVPETPPELADLGAPEVPETTEQRADRARDEAGRFAKQETPRETLTLKQPPAVDPNAPPATPAQASKEPAIPPPQEWKGFAKTRWEGLARPIQEELAQKYEALAQERAETAPLAELINVNRQFLVNEAGSIPEAFRQMVQQAKLYVENPGALIQSIARAKGVDLAALAGGQAQPSGQQQPGQLPSNIAQLIQQELQPYVAQFQQTEHQQLTSQIQAFASDPAHPFFNDVRQLMGTLMESGQADTMQAAYEMATRAHPTTYAQTQLLEREAVDKRKAEEVAKARQANRASLTGSPTTGASSLNGGSPNASIRDTLVNALNEQMGRV